MAERNGFIYVGKEVRDLVSKSTDASRSTAGLIEESGESVRKGIELIDETASALVRTVGEVNDVVEMLGQISDATQKQSDSILHVGGEVGHISNIVYTNSETSEESAATAKELSNQSRYMNEIVNKFKLK